jgi:integrase
VTKQHGLTTLAVTRAKPKRDRAGRAVRTERPDPACKGLYLIVQPGGARSWAVRFRTAAGRPKKLTLGPFAAEAVEPSAEPKVGQPLTLAAARKLAAAALHLVEMGRDPSAEKQRVRPSPRREETFEAVAESFLKRQGKTLRSAETMRANLKRLIYPSLAAMPIGDIRRTDVVRLLDDIEDRSGPVMADRALALVRRVSNWHVSRSDDFSSPVARGMARTKPRERARERILTDDELRAVWSAAESAGRFGAFVRFLLLTAARRNEAAELPRSELSEAVWVLPAERNKVKQELARPLAAAARDLLGAIPQAGTFVFGVGDHPLGGFSKFKAAFDQSCGVTGWTLHDLRRTARSLMSRAGVRPDVAELCLGHVVGGVRGVYDRHEYSEEKRQAFEALAAQIDRIINPQLNVTQLRPNVGGAS